MVSTMPELPLDKLVIELGNIQVEYNQYFGNENSKINALLSSANAYIKENKNETAKKVLQQAWNIMNEYLESLAYKEIEYIKGKLTELRTSGEDIKEMREYLKQTRIAAENGNYISAVRVAKIAHELVERQHEGNAVNEQPEQSPAAYTQQTSGGTAEVAETSSADKNIAKNEEQSQSALPEQMREYIDLYNIIDLAINNDIDMRNLKDELKNELIVLSESHKKIRSEMEKLIWDRINVIKGFQSFYKKSGIDIKNLDENIEDLRHSIENENFTLGISQLSSIQEKLMDPSLILPVVQKEMDIAKYMMILTESQNKLFKEGNALLEKGELRQSFDVLYSLHKELAIGIKENLNLKLGEIAEIIELIKGGSSALNEYLSMQQSFISDLQEDSVINAYENYIKIKGMSEKTFFQIIVQKSGDLRIKTLAAKNMGVVLNINLTEFLENIKKLTNEKKLVEALHVLKMEEDRVSNHMQLYKEISAVVSDIEGKIKKMKEAGMDTKKMEAKLMDIYGITNKDYEGALKISKALMEDLNKFLDSYRRTITIDINMVDKIEKNKTLWGEFVIKNEGDVDIHDLVIISESSILEDPGKIGMMRRGDSKKVKFTTVFNSDRESIGIKIEGKDAFKESSIITEYKKTFEVAPSSPAAGTPAVVQQKVKGDEKTVLSVNTPQGKPVEKAVKGVAKGDEVCRACKGYIKSGLPVLICSCGAIYHYTCGSRVKVCLQCKKDLV